MSETVNSNKFLSDNTPRTDPLAINIGLDFGTSYTKLCYRIRSRGINQVKIITLPVQWQPCGIIPSIVYENDNTLYTAVSPTRPENCVLHKYLKMKLATLWLAEPDTEKNSTILIAAYFLAEIIKACKQYISNTESELMQGKRVQWYAKICVPIGDQDKKLLDSFGDFYSKCWQLANCTYENTIPAIDKHYSGFVADAKDSPCQAYPEVAAAVHSFLLTRLATPGLYCYLDVGGGTLDCSAFHLKKSRDGLSSIYVYSTQVSRHGLESISERTGISSELISQMAMQKFPDSTLKQKLTNVQREIQEKIATAIIELRDKAKVDGSWHLYFNNFTVYLGGGGAKCLWYRQTIQDTSLRWNPSDSIRKNFHLNDIPSAEELTLPDSLQQEQNRFLVAFGLTAPVNEDTPIQGFPWEFSVKPLKTEPALALDYDSSIPCTCRGGNPDCVICGGWGSIDKISAHRVCSTVTIDNIKQAEDIKRDSPPKKRLVVKVKRNLVDLIEPNVEQVIKISSLAELMEFLKKRGIDYTNNRKLGGGFWVLINKLEFESIARQLEQIGIMCKYHEDGRKKHPGSQWELDTKKILQ